MPLWYLREYKYFQTIKIYTAEKLKCKPALLNRCPQCVAPPSGALEEPSAIVSTIEMSTFDMITESIFSPPVCFLCAEKKQQETNKFQSLANTFDVHVPDFWSKSDRTRLVIQTWGCLGTWVNLMLPNRISSPRYSLFLFAGNYEFEFQFFVI